jgi:hypothetical protein
MNQEQFVMERAKLLFGGYRRGDANDPDTYVLSVAAVLAMYQAEVVREVTDPRTGISTHEKFRAYPPNSGELKAHCDGVAARRDRLAKYAALPKSTLQRLPEPSGPKPPGSRANLLVRRGTARYEAMVERARDADPADWRTDAEGIRVPFDWY